MISTRLTKFFDIEHPIILAPMTPAAGADLSSAVAAAGGLGLLGGGYGDRSWFEAESAKITRNDVGCVSSLGLSHNNRTCSTSQSSVIRGQLCCPLPILRLSRPASSRPVCLSSARSIPSTRPDEQPMSGPMLSLLKARKRAAMAKQRGRRYRSCRR